MEAKPLLGMNEGFGPIPSSVEKNEWAEQDALGIAWDSQSPWEAWEGNKTSPKPKERGQAVSELMKRALSSGNAGGLG